MRSFPLTAVLAASALLVLTGCANEQSEPTSTSSPSPDTVSEAPAETPTESTTPEATPTPSEREDESPSQAPSPLELTTSSETITLDLTDVYCSGQPGQLHHLIGKTNHQLPLVEVTPGEFAMVKIGQGRPFKSPDPHGVTVIEDGITFADTSLGDATLNGTVTCTTWED